MVLNAWKVLAAASAINRGASIYNKLYKNIHKHSFYGKRYRKRYRRYRKSYRHIRYSRTKSNSVHAKTKRRYYSKFSNRGVTTNITNPEHKYFSFGFGNQTYGF